MRSQDLFVKAMAGEEKSSTFDDLARLVANKESATQAAKLSTSSSSTSGASSSRRRPTGWRLVAVTAPRKLLPRRQPRHRLDRIRPRQLVGSAPRSKSGKIGLSAPSVIVVVTRSMSSIIVIGLSRPTIWYCSWFEDYLFSRAKYINS